MKVDATALLKELNALEKKVQRKMVRTTLRNACKKIQVAAKDEAPKESGNLKRQIKVRAGKKSRVKVSMLVQLAAKPGDKYYAAFVEYGTQKMKGMNFLKEAVKKVGQKVMDEALKELKEAIEAG